MDTNPVDKYIKESCKSYRKATVKNSARRNSLLKTTLGIETERKLVSAQMAREEKLLREQLKSMQLEKCKAIPACQSCRQKKNYDEATEQQTPTIRIPSADVNPYPINFPCRTPSPSRRHMNHEDKGRLYAARRARRTSREFEDLHLNTQTGKLAAPKPPLSLLHSPALMRRLRTESGSSISSTEDLSSSLQTSTRLSRKKRPTRLK